MKGYTSDYTEDTVLAVAFKYDGSNWVNQVLNSYVAEKITSGVSAYTKDYIKADGTKYTYAAQVDGADADSTYNSDDEYDIYVSKGWLCHCGHWRWPGQSERCVLCHWRVWRFFQLRRCFLLCSGRSM